MPQGRLQEIIITPKNPQDVEGVEWGVDKITTGLGIAPSALSEVLQITVTCFLERVEELRVNIKALLGDDFKIEVRDKIY